MNYIEEFIKFLNSQEDRPSKVTVKNYLSDVNHLVRWYENTFGSFVPKEVTRETIEQYKQQSTTISPRSLERHLSSLRKFFTFLKLEGMIIRSPFERLEINGQKPEADPYRIKDFKNFLYVYNASHLTIKNYLIDTKQFFAWANEITASNNVLNQIDSGLIEAYKQKLLTQGNFSPATINRKLSSLRKYLSWAQSEGLIYPQAGISNVQFPISNQLDNGTIQQPVDVQPSATSYSSFPPLRLAQKISNIFLLTLDGILIIPVANLVEKTQYSLWKVKGQPVFARIKVLTSNSQLPIIKNLTKESYAPLEISTKHFSWYKKTWFNLKYTRPKWYKIYHSYPIVHYFHFAVLVIFLIAITFGFYNVLFQKGNQAPTLAANLPVAPPRILSFQGRLTDNFDNPISTRIALRFAIYNNATSTGSALLWQEVDSIAPDQDGIFNVMLGNNSAIPSTLFTQNSALWLGVTVGMTPELTPRQPLATVAYATNAESLQGLVPITAAGAGQTNVVLALDSSGNLTIGGSAAPTFQATGGQFKILGQPLLLGTNAGSNSNVAIAPDGMGYIDLQKPLVNTTNNNNLAGAQGAVEVDDMLAVLATSSGGQSAFTLNQDGSGPLIAASTGGVAKFTVDNSGNLSAAGTGLFSGNLTTGGNLNLTGAFMPGNLAGTTGQILTSSGAGVAPTWSSTIPATSVPFSGITSGTNTTAAMVVGTGASLGFSETGTIDASSLIGGTWATPGAIGTTTPNTGAFTTISASGQITSTLATGTAPFAVSSTTVNANLNADLLDGQNGSYYAPLGNISGTTNYVAKFTGTNSVGNSIIYDDGTNVGIGTTNPVAPLHIAGAYGSNAALIVDQLNNGDIFTASASGVTKFVISNTGALTDAAYTNAGGVLYTSTTGLIGQTGVGTGTQCLTGGATPTWASCSAAASNFWQRVGGALSPLTSSDDLLLGGSTTASAKFAFTGLMGNQTQASFSGQFIVMPNNGYSGMVGIGTGTPQALTDIYSASNVLPANGLMNLYWNPTVANTTFNGDLLSLNVGANGIANNLLNIKNNGSSVFSVSQVQMTSNVPAQFNAAGDVAMAYDLNFTNPTASYIKSQAPLYIQAGELFNSSNLTLRTFNAGNIIADTQAFVTNYAATVSSQLVVGTQSPNSSAIGGLYLTNSSTFGKALAILDQYENQDIFTASASGVTKFVISNTGALTDAAYTNAGGVLYTSTTGLIGQTGVGTGTQCLTGGATPTWVSCSSAASNFWQRVGGALSPLTSSDDLLLGSSSTSSAVFAFTGLMGNQTQASFSGQFIVMPNNGYSGRVGIGLTNPAFNLDVAGTTNTYNLLSHDILLGTSSASLLTAFKGFNGYTNFSGGIGTGGVDSILNAQRLTSTGNLVNIGSIQAGETLLTTSATLSAAVNYATGTGPDSVAIGDLNGDGKADLVTANYDTNNVSVLINNGNGTFAAPVNYTVGTTPYLVAIGDLNGDGKADLAVANFNTNNVSVLINNGNGTFATAVNYATGTGPRSVAIGDVNGDGKADIVVLNTSGGSVSVLINNGNGTFAAPVNYTAGTNPRSVVIGDVNGDGKADLAVANQSTNNVSVLINNGNGTFAAPVNYATGTGPYSVVIGDLNGDGKADLAVANFNTNNVSVLINNGNGTFATAVNYTAGTNPRSVAIGDLNGDGKADLVVANYSNNNVSVLLNQTSPIFYAQASTGFVGIGTTNPLAMLDVRGIGSNSGTLAVGSFSGQTSFASLVANNNGVGDLFTASASGITRFIVDNSGNVQSAGVLQTNSVAGTAAYNRLGTNITDHGLSSANDLLISGGLEVNGTSYFDGYIGTNLIPSVGSAYSLGNTNYRWNEVWADNLNVGNLNVVATNISGTNSPTFTIDAGNVTNDTENSSFTFERGLSATNVSLTWDSVNKQINLNAPMIISQDPTVTNSGTAALIVNQIQAQDIFSASASGIPKFTIGNSGNVTAATSFSAPQLISTVATGTAPFVVASTTNVANLNASSLNGATFAAPGAIGSVTPGSGAFTTLTSSGNSTIGTGAATTNTFGAGASSVNTIGSATTPGALTLHGATTLDNTFTVSGSNLTTLGGNLTFAGANPVIIPSTLNTPIFLNANGSGTVNIGGASTGDVNLAGGSMVTGCTITNSTGDLACSGNIIGNAAGTVGYWTRSGTSLYNTNQGDNVGIGTTSPGTKLEVDGTKATPPTSGTTSSGIFRVRGSNAILEMGMYPDPSNVAWIQVDNATAYGNYYGLALNPNGGNVGIGTTSPGPSLRLQVAGKIVAAEGTPNGDATYGAGFSFDESGRDTGMFSEANNQLQFFTTNVERIRIDSSGNVGIGTTGPLSKLSVGGAGSSTYAIYGNSVGGVGVYGNSTVYGVYGYSTSSSGGAGVYGYDTVSNGIGVYGTGGGGVNGGDFFGSNGEKTVAGVWTNGSSRTLKENFTNVNSQEILNKILALPITEWNYKTFPTAKYIGPVAEDFYALFGLGADNRSIDTIDPAALALVGIKALNENLASLSANLVGVSLTSTGDLNLVDQNVSDANYTIPHYFTLNDILGNPITRVGAFAEIAVANLRAGSANIQQLTTNALNVATENITINGQNIRDYIAGIVTSIINSTNNNIVSPIASSDEIHTNLISPLAKNSQIGLKLENNKLSILNGNSASSSAVAVFDNQGNASFSGQLSASSGQFGEATVSGTLHAGKIIADEIVGASPSASITNTNITNIYNSTPAASNFPILTATLATGSSADVFQQLSNLAMNHYLDISSYSGQLAYVENLSAANAAFSQGLMVFGPTSLSDTSVVGQLSIDGSLILANNSINVLGSDLNLQPLRQGGLSIMGGLVYIDTEGNLKVGGNAEFAKDVTVKGNLAAGVISPLPGNDLKVNLGNNGSSFMVNGASNSAVLSVNPLGDLVASGAATIAKLNLSLIQPALAVSPSEIIATGSAGTAGITPYRTQVTIDNTLVTDKSLIYITPTSSTNNQVLYLLRQVPGESFTVGLQNPSVSPIPFNWIIVN